MPELTQRINDGLQAHYAADLRDLDEQIVQQAEKLRRLVEQRAALVARATRKVEEVAAAQVSPEDEDQDAERWDGLS